MIVIVASRWDEHAHVLARRWAAADARVMTPRDLSRPGWRQRLSSAGTAPAGTAVIAGEVVPQGEISAVLNRLPCVIEDELAHIIPSDRAYVRSEMEAFLVFWLARLGCPVFNRPQPNCLVGPGWSLEGWACVAAEAGLPVVPLHSPQSPPPAPELAPATTSVIVVGSQCFGEADPTLQAHALRLAAAAQVELLEVRFAAGRFAGLNLLPNLVDDLSDGSLAEEVLALLQRPSQVAG